MVSWVPNVEHRNFPIIQIRRLGGVRHRTKPDLLGKPVIELTVHRKEGLPETEQFYEDVLEALYEAVRNQTQTPAGYLHSIFETMGSTQFSSQYQDAWRVQGLLQLAVRPRRNN